MRLRLLPPRLPVSLPTGPVHNVFTAVHAVAMATEKNLEGEAGTQAVSVGLLYQVT